jgi:hypothetical protein
MYLLKFRGLGGLSHPIPRLAGRLGSSTEEVKAMIYELNDTELDVVAAGAPLFVGGLVNVGVSDIDILSNNPGFLSNFEVNVLNDSIKDIAKNNNVGVGAIIQALGGVAAIRGAQTA